MPDRAVSDSPTVQEQLDRLAQASLPRDVLGFDRIRALLAKLGNPERALPPVFHVAGTNGKGSTCAFLRSAIEATGLKVHVYTSPHLVRLNERIRIAGKLIEDASLAELLAEIVDAAGDGEITFFEATTAAAFLAFSRHEADACIVEVGIGGRLDATNVIPTAAICGIAQLGLDHRQFLGDRIEDVAAEKAGIAKPGVPLVTQSYPARLANRIKEVARTTGAVWLPRGGKWDAAARDGELHYQDEHGALRLPLPRLPGDHQTNNAALAVAMLRHQQALKVNAAALRAAVGWTEWPARLQQLESGPLRGLLPPDSQLWLDGAHNPAAARAVADFFRTRVPANTPFHVVLGLLAEKDAGGVLRSLRGRSSTVHTVPVRAYQYHSSAELAAAARNAGLNAIPAESVEAALLWIGRHADRTAPPIVLIMGSLYLAGEVLRANGQAPA